MALIVQKFGGTSVGSVERIRNVARRVAKWKAAGHDLVVVPSAMAGETNRLIALAKELQTHPDPRELDVVATSGEQVTIGLLAMALMEQGVKARSYTGWQVKVLWHVVLPLVRPALAAVSVLVFTFIWNDYFWALVLAQSDEVRPLTAGLQSLRGMWQTSWQLVSAASILAALPPVALFFLMQRHLIAGLSFSTRPSSRSR